MSTCFIVYLIALIMYRLFLCHYSLLVDEKMNFITPCFWKLSCYINIETDLPSTYSKAGGLNHILAEQCRIQSTAVT